MCAVVDCTKLPVSEKYFYKNCTICDFKFFLRENCMSESKSHGPDINVESLPWFWKCLFCHYIACYVIYRTLFLANSKDSIDFFHIITSIYDMLLLFNKSIWKRFQSQASKLSGKKYSPSYCQYGFRSYIHTHLFESNSLRWIELVVALDIFKVFYHAVTKIY